MSHEPASKGRKTAWTVVSTVILALGLFGCSGGGGGGNVVGITPQPPGGDHPDTRANAAVVRPGQEIEATLASADDVDFFRIDLAERQEIKFTLDAEAGIEIAVLDSDGNVIATAVTESKVETTISAVGRIFIRVRDKTKRGWDRLNRTKGVKAYSFVMDVVAVAKTIINIKRGIPHYMLTVGGVGVDFDLRDHFTLPDGRRVVSSVTARLPGVSASIQGTTVRLSASGATVPGGVRLVLKLCIPLTSYCFHEAFAATVIPPRATALRVKPEFRTSGGSFTLAAGERKQITFLRNYFEREVEPAQEGSPAWTRERRSWRYTAAFVPPNPRPRGWTAAITGTSPDQLLRVVAPASSDTQAPDEVVVAVTVTKTVTARERQTATVRFTFEVEEEEETPTPPDSGGPSFACYFTSGTHTSCAEYFPGSRTTECSPTRTRRSSCPITDERYPLITSCDYRGRSLPFANRERTFNYLGRNNQPTILSARSGCVLAGGVFTIHKQ